MGEPQLFENIRFPSRIVSEMNTSLSNISSGSPVGISPNTMSLSILCEILAIPIKLLVVAIMIPAQAVPCSLRVVFFVMTSIFEEFKSSCDV